MCEAFSQLEVVVKWNTQIRFFFNLLFFESVENKIINMFKGRIRPKPQCKNVRVDY